MISRKRKADLCNCGSMIRTDFSGYVIITYPVRRSVQKIDITKNAGHSEFILVLKITAVTPLKHKNGKQIISLDKKLCDIKFRGVMRDLAVSHISAVQPDIEA